MTLSSKDFARSLDTPPTMIDRNHTVIADSKAEYNSTAYFEGS